MSLEAAKTYMRQMAANGQWNRLRERYSERRGNEAEYDFAQELLRGEDERIAREAANAAAQEHEAKVGRGPAPKQAEISDVMNRLKAMGVSEADLPVADRMYNSMFHALSENPHLTPKEIEERLIASKQFHPDEIKAMQRFFPQAREIAAADTGTQSHTQDFNDPVSRRNFLLANHFSPAEIDKIDASNPPNPYTGKTSLPADAQETVRNNIAKHNRGRETRTKEEQEKQFRMNVSAPVEAGSTTESSKVAQDLGLLGAQTLAHEYSKGPKHFEGKKWADMTPEERQSQAIRKNLNPDVASRRVELENLKNNLSSQMGSNASKAAAPYLKNATSDFAAQHKRLFGDIENAHEQSLIDKMNKNYLEKIAPRIKQGYLTPGVKWHGHIGKEAADFLGQAQEGTARAINETRAANRAQSIGATLGNQKAQLEAGNLAGQLSAQDLDASLKGTQGLEALRANHEAKKAEHAQTLKQIGEENRAEEEKKYNDDYERFQKEEQHGPKFAAAALNAANQLPADVMVPEAMPERKEKTFNKTLASTLGGLGFHGLGATNSAQPIHKAVGGQVNPVEQQAVQNAVTQGTSPLYELGRFVTNDAHLSMMQAKQNQRKRFAKGGMVDPIAAGASQAKSVSDADELRKKAAEARMKMFEEEPDVAEEKPSELSGWVRAAMAGAASSGNDDWLARTGRAYTGAAQAHEAGQDKKKLEAREKRKERMERRKTLADLSNHIFGEQHQEREFGLNEKKLALAEKMGEAQIGHYNALNNSLNAKQEVGKSLTADQRKAKKEALENIKTGIKIKRDVDAGKDLLGKVETGPISGFLSNHLGSLGQGLASLTNKGDITQRQGVNRIGGSLFLGAHQSMKNIPRSSEFAKRIEDIKFNASNTPEANLEALGMNAELGEDSLATGVETLRDLGYSDEKINEVIEMYARENLKTEKPSQKSSNSNESNPGKQAAAIAELKRRGVL